MKFWYVLLLTGMTVALTVVSALGLKKKNHNLRLLWHLTIVTLVMVVSYVTGVYATSETLILFGHGIYCACYVWMVAFFLRFITQYSGSRIINRPMRMVIFVLTIANTASFLINTYTRHAFTVYEETFIDGLSYHYYNTNTPFYAAHMLFAYILSVLVAGILVYNMIHLKGIYRRRYVILLGIFVSMLLIDAFFMLFGLPLDLNLFTYIIMQLMLSYFVGSYIPRDIILRLLTYASSSVQNALVCFDENMRMVYANPEAYRLMCLKMHDPHLEQILGAMYRDRDLDEKDCLEWTDRFTTPDGVRWYGYDYQIIEDDTGHRIGYYFAIRDKTEETIAFDREKTRATHDSLTGLYNTDGFIEHAQEMLKNDPDTPRFMLSSNIRDFKLVNDLFGLEKGDEILVRIADLLQEQCSANTVCGRVGADQFVVLIRRSDFHEEDFKRGMDEVASLIRSSSYRLRIQIGVYAIDDLTMSIPSMYDRAKVAITSLRDESSSRIVYYSPQMMQRSRRERRIIDELEESILNGALRIYLQPQVDRQGIVQGAEALVRWIHTEQGVIMPGRFISVLEDAGLIYQLDLAVWEMACKQLRAWQGTDMENLYLSVNISPRDFYYIDIFASFTDLVTRYGVDPSRIHLEIIESALMNDFQVQHALVKRLRDYGFRVEIDDFGSGYSSLSMLKDLQVDALKIDMEFLRETENKSRARTILRNIVTMSHELHMPVITEGVENQAQLDYLGSLGCNCFQGFLFSRPIPVREFEQIYYPAHAQKKLNPHTAPQFANTASGSPGSF